MKICVEEEAVLPHVDFIVPKSVNSLFWFYHPWKFDLLLWTKWQV